MRTLKAQGKSIIFITHKLKEVLEIADVITVMRLGEVVGTTTPAETNEEALATMMVGRNVNLVVQKPPAEPGDVALAVTDLFVQDDRGLTAVKGVSFEVRAGEILAFAGVQGNGQTELVEALTGLRRVTAGSVVLNGSELVGQSVRDVLNEGVGHVPEDRQRHGLVLSMSIADNLVLDQLSSPKYKSFWGRKLKAIEENGARRIAEYDIRAQSEAEPLSSLSGGNQQKVVMARELSRELKVLICAPTDAGARRRFH